MEKLKAVKMVKAAASSRLVRLLLFAFAFSTLYPLPSPLSAEVPVKFTYQGNLRQSGFLVNGRRSMVFRIYNSSDAPLGTELWKTIPPVDVSISTGVFRVTLEPDTIADWQSGSLWLELEVDGNRMSPREELTSSPYAVNSLLHSGKKYTNSGVAPLLPNTGDLWMNTALNTLYFWNGSGWTSTAGSGAVHAITHAGGGLDAITSLGAYNITGDVTLNAGVSLRSSGPGVMVSTNLIVTGDIYANKFYGDGSGLTGVVAAGDNLGNHVAAQILNMSGFQISNAGAITGSSFTATGIGLGAAQLRLADNVRVSSEASAALGAGVNISSNVYIVGFSSAAKYYGDGSGLTGIVAAGDNLGNHTAVGILKMAGFDITGVSTVTVSSVTTTAAAVTVSTNVFITGNVGIGLPAAALARLEVKGVDTQSYSLAVGTGTAHQLVVSTSGAVGIGTETPAAQLDVTGSQSDEYIAIFNSGPNIAAWLRNK